MLPRPRAWRAAGIAHAFLGLATGLGLTLAFALTLALLALLSELLAQLVEQFAELALRIAELVEVRRAFALLAAGAGLLFALLSLLPLLAALSRTLLLAALGPPLFLVAAEGLVAQLLLATDHVGETVQRAFALLAVLALLLLLAAGWRPCSICCSCISRWAWSRAPLRVSSSMRFSRAAQVMRPDLPGVRIALGLLLLAAVLAVAHGLFGQLAHQPVHGLAEILRQTAELLLRGAALDRLPKPFGGLRHGPLGLGDVAVLHAHRDIPEIGDDVAESRIVAGAHQPEIGGPEAEIDRRLHAETVGRRGQRLKRPGDARRRHRRRAPGSAAARRGRAEWFKLQYRRPAGLPAGRLAFLRLRGSRFAFVPGAAPRTLIAARSRFAVMIEP